MEAKPKKEVIKEKDLLDKDKVIARLNWGIQKYNPDISNQGCGELTAQDFYDAGIKYGNHPYFIMAIAVADSSLGKNLTNNCNLGNTGHCDSCSKGNQYRSYKASVNSISQTVSNKYLGHHTKSCQFAGYMRSTCPASGKFYASGQNWGRNVNIVLAQLSENKFNDHVSIKL